MPPVLNIVVLMSLPPLVFPYVFLGCGASQILYFFKLCQRRFTQVFKSDILHNVRYRLSNIRKNPGCIQQRHLQRAAQQDDVLLFMLQIVSCMPKRFY